VQQVEPGFARGDRHRHSEAIEHQEDASVQYKPCAEDDEVQPN
jgi:hypothetical protein